MDSHIEWFAKVDGQRTDSTDLTTFNQLINVALKAGLAVEYVGAKYYTLDGYEKIWVGLEKGDIFFNGQKIALFLPKDFNLCGGKKIPLCFKCMEKDFTLDAKGNVLAVSDPRCGGYGIGWSVEWRGEVIARWLKIFEPKILLQTTDPIISPLRKEPEKPGTTQEGEQPQE